MALPDLYAGGVVANVQDPPQISLVKLVALLRELTIGGTTGTTGISTIGGTIGAPDIATNQVAMTDAATVIAAERPTRRAITIKNSGATNVLYVGVSGVTDSTGFPLSPSEGVTINTTEAVYGIAASGLTTTASFIEEYSS